jgi:hypothetical protein
MRYAYVWPDLSDYGIWYISLTVNHLGRHRDLDNIIKPVIDVIAMCTRLDDNHLDAIEVRRVWDEGRPSGEVAFTVVADPPDMAHLDPPHTTEVKPEEIASLNAFPQAHRK